MGTIHRVKKIVKSQGIEYFTLFKASKIDQYINRPLVAPEISTL